jgi:hypothetical protein
MWNPPQLFSVFLLHSNLNSFFVLNDRGTFYISKCRYLKYLSGIESLYNGLSETTKGLDIWSQINKIRVFENNEHFEFLKKKGAPQLFSAGWAGLSSEWCGLQVKWRSLYDLRQGYKRGLVGKGIAGSHIWKLGRADPTHLGGAQERQMRHFHKLAGGKKIPDSRKIITFLFFIICQ